MKLKILQTRTTCNLLSQKHQHQLMIQNIHIQYILGSGHDW